MNANRWVFSSALFVLTLGMQQLALAQTGAKALFHSGEGTTIASKPNAAVASAPSASATYMGIAYWIERQATDGKVARTSTSREFRTGERVRLQIKPNKGGYLYVINIGSTGSSTVLYPRAGEENAVIANETYSVPGRGFMRFDDNPGVETLLVIVSSKPLSNLAPQIAPRQEKYDVASTQRLQEFANERGAKDLVIEDDFRTSRSSAAHYAVAPLRSLDGGKVITITVKLKHTT